MSATLKLYTLDLSPNNKKVRLALGIKGLEYERIPVDPGDRSLLVEISGQPFTPVLTHGETVLIDSHAIVRYLENNVQREPRLFSADYAEMRAIEHFESVARGSLGQPVGAVFREALSGDPRKDALDAASQAFDEQLEKLDAALADTGYLVGERITAADVFCAGMLGVANLTERAAKKHPVLAVFFETLRLNEELESLTRWWNEINAFDRSRFG